MNNLTVFNNKEFGEVRGILINGEPYLVGKDVVKNLGYDLEGKHVASEYIKKYCDKEDYVLYDKNSSVKFDSVLDYKELGQRGGYLINGNAVCILISKSKVKSTEYKRQFKNWLVSEGVIKDEFIVESRKEIEFLDALEKVLEPFGYECIRQYKVLNYKIDLYIKDLNIAIEYDENDHKHYTCEKHEDRQKEIEKELNCKFIRVSDKESDLYNIGVVMKGMVA